MNTDQLHTQPFPTDAPSDIADAPAPEQQDAELKPPRRARRFALRKRRSTRTKRIAKVKTPKKEKLSAGAIKNRIQAKLGSLSNTRLKQVLIACGIATGLAVAIIAFTKFVPVGVAILAILGLGVVVRFMQELRHLPFCVYPSL